jgi:hypothetical protein
MLPTWSINTQQVLHMLGHKVTQSVLEFPYSANTCNSQYINRHSSPVYQLAHIETFIGSSRVMEYPRFRQYEQVVSRIRIQTRISNRHQIPVSKWYTPIIKLHIGNITGSQHLLLPGRKMYGINMRARQCQCSIMGTINTWYCSTKGDDMLSEGIKSAQHCTATSNEARLVLAHVM